MDQAMLSAAVEGQTQLRETLQHLVQQTLPNLQNSIPNDDNKQAIEMLAHELVGIKSQMGSLALTQQVVQYPAEDYQEDDDYHEETSEEDYYDYDPPQSYFPVVHERGTPRTGGAPSQNTYR